jgi:hypothetical protein
VIIVFIVQHVVVRGEITRHVVCDKCHHAFDYVLARSAALDTVPLPILVRKAEQICRERLSRRLAADVDPHPCPACGWVQAHMVPELRRRFAKPLGTVGLFLAIAFAALGLLFLALGVWFRFYPVDADVDWFGIAIASAAGCALGILMMLARSLLGMLRYRAGGHVSNSRASGASLPRPA